MLPPPYHAAVATCAGSPPPNEAHPQQGSWTLEAETEGQGEVLCMLVANLGTTPPDMAQPVVDLEVYMESTQSVESAQSRWFFRQREAPNPPWVHQTLYSRWWHQARVLPQEVNPFECPRHDHQHSTPAHGRPAPCSPRLALLLLRVA